MWILLLKKADFFSTFSVPHLSAALKKFGIGYLTGGANLWILKGQKISPEASFSRLTSGQIFWSVLTSFGKPHIGHYFKKRQGQTAKKGSWP